MSPPWPPGSATGTGPVGGTDPSDAVKLVLDELASFPHLPELPERGVGADHVGRTAAMLVDLHVETTAGGWRLVARQSPEERHAASLLARDLDALEAAAGEHEGAIKVQAIGPWTLACALELPGGERVVSDLGATEDLTASLAEGTRAHVAELRRRLPRIDGVVVELDESLLGAALGGEVATASGFRRYPAVDELVALDLEAEALRQGEGQLAGVRFDRPGAPLVLLRRAGARFFSLERGLLRPEAEEELGEALESGLGLLVGLVPTNEDGPVELEELAVPVRRLWGRLGLDPGLLPELVVVTPTAGLDGLSPARAATVLRRCSALGTRLEQDPEGTAEAQG